MEVSQPAFQVGLQIPGGTGANSTLGSRSSYSTKFATRWSRPDRPPGGRHDHTPDCKRNQRKKSFVKRVPESFWCRWE